MYQPQDEVPDFEIRDGKRVSKNPTEPKERAAFAIEEILLTLDQRPILEAAAIFRNAQDLKGFVRCFETCVMDIKTLGSHVFVTLKPGE
jgi:hypothetical protein